MLRRASQYGWGSECVAALSQNCDKNSLPGDGIDSRVISSHDDFLNTYHRSEFCSFHDAASDISIVGANESAPPVLCHLTVLPRTCTSPAAAIILNLWTRLLARLEYKTQPCKCPCSLATVFGESIQMAASPRVQKPCERSA